MISARAAWITRLSLYCLSILPCVPSVSLAQETYRPDAVWSFGSYPSSDPEFGLIDLTFQKPNTFYTLRDSQSTFCFAFTATTYVHPKFKLYGNGCTLVRNITDTVERHTRLDPGGFHDSYCAGLLRGDGFQYILPLGDDTLLYLSEMRQGRLWPAPAYYHTVGYGMSYLSVDKLTNLDDVSNQAAVVKSFPFFPLDTALHEVVDHVSDGRGGWWGVARAELSPHFIRWRITSDTVLRLPPIVIGETSTVLDSRKTRLRFNAAGNAFAFVGSRHGIMICDFDRATGDINFRTQFGYEYNREYSERYTTMDCEWSASGRFLYVTGGENVYQFDTWAHDIEASAVKLSKPRKEFPYTWYQEIERGPDCRIYIGSHSSEQTLSVIDKPDLKGLASDPKPSQVYLRRWNYGILPNSFPNYSLWARDRVARGLAPIIDTAVCDATIGPPPYFVWVGVEEVAPVALPLSVYPNPITSGGQLTLQVSDRDLLDATEVYVARLLDASGREVMHTRRVELWAGLDTFDIPGLAAGTYLLQVAGTRSKTMVTRQVVVQ